MQTLLITGASGMLGWECTRFFSNRWNRGPVVALDRGGLDITNPARVREVMSEFKPAWVLNTAAYTNVDGAESERTAAREINGVAVKYLADACAEFGARLVQYSTDQVFDGTGNTPWSEDAPTRPANFYAQTKWEGEQSALSSPGALVLRVQWLYGERKDRFKTLRGKKIFTPFADQFGAPTWTRDICGLTAELMEKSAEGIFHLSYDDYASWAEVFAYARDVMGLDLELVPKQTREVSLPANRPLFSVMSNQKLLSFLGRDKIGSWKDALRTFLTLP